MNLSLTTSSKTTVKMLKNRFRQGMILVYNVYETAPYTCIAFNFFGKEIFDGLFYYRVLLQRMLRLQY